MAVSDEKLDAIEERNKQRRMLKEAASPGPWVYDSFGFVHQAQRVPRSKRLGILVRPMQWFRELGDRIDEGFSQTKFIQAYYDADYVAHARTDGAEDDIDLLLAAVRRLRRIAK